MNKQIIPATQHDVELVCRLFEQAIAFVQQHNYIGWSIYDIATIRSDIEKGQLYKIMKEKDLLGIFSLYTADPLIWGNKEKGNAVYLHRIVLNQTFKGEKLVPHILDWARDHAIHHRLDFIRIDTWAANEKLINYYKSYGFRFIEHFRSGDTPELPIQHRNLDLVLLELTVQADNIVIE